MSNRGRGLPTRIAFRSLAAPFAALAPWLVAVPALAQVPDCFKVEAHAAPSPDGEYEHSLIFINGCDLRMDVRARYSDAPGSTAKGSSLATGDLVTITLGVGQPTQAFSAHYDVTYERRSEAPLVDKPATGTVRSTAPRTEPPRTEVPRTETTARSSGRSAPPGGSLPLAKLCDRAMRKIFKIEGLSEKDPQLKARIVNCPSRVGRDPPKRRAEMECALGARTREDLRVCFGAK